MRIYGCMIVAALLGLAGGAMAQGDGYHWYKGNTHTHTTNSDGDSTPGLVARWYRNNGYDFLFITDHNKLTDVLDIQSEIDQENARDARKKFLLIPGVEVSNNLTKEERKYAVHICGLDTKTTVGKQDGPTVRALLQKSIDAIHAAGGLPSVNHPNFQWSLTTDDIFSLHDLKHYEIFNGHPMVNNMGGGDVPSMEEMWDDLLSRGRKYFGVAVDDAHHYKEFRKDLSNPGRGWVVVRARALDSKNIMQGLETGDFYASTGVVLQDLWTTPGKGIALTLNSDKLKFRTEFIGKGGKILKTDKTTSPSYELQSDDLYVRAKVTASTGDIAWTQPVYLVEPAPVDSKATARNDEKPSARNHSHIHGSISHSH